MRKTSSFFLLSLFLAAMFAILPASAAAQDDPPGRVARLNYVQGSVSYQLAGNQDWVRADPNRPLTTGDNLWADQNSRGEVHVGSTAIRLADNTGISFLTLDDRTVQMQLAQGTIQVHLRHLSPGEAFEIDTPNLALTLTRGGQYEIQTDPGGASTIVIVRAGEAQVTGGGDSYELRSGQQYTFAGTDDLTYDAQVAPGFDDFEDWCQSRDDRENSSPSARYVSRDVDGYYDLDEYGSWESDDDYGMVWVPQRVAVGWAPYHYGHWVYIVPWGWTWMDDEPWGFAPFHYGRWSYMRNRWAWVPGPMVVRPVYAPALVAFVGGGGFSVGVSFGGGFSGVAWFPLGPRDVYVPAYRCSHRYVQNVNITNTRVVNITQVTNVYNTVVINRDVTHVNYMYANDARSVIAVSRETFVGARPVGAGAIRITSEQIGRARVTDSQPVTPTNASYISSTARISNVRPAIPFSERSAVVRLNPATETRQRQIQEPGMPGRAPNQPTAPRGGATTGQEQPRPGYRSFEPPKGTTTAQPPRGTLTEQSPQSTTTPQPPRGRTFEQPTRGTGAAQPSPTGRGATTQAPSQQQQPPPEERRSMRYAPPVKAREEMYDVHPPAERKQVTPPPQQQQQQRRSEPPKQQPQDRKQHDDSKH
jgi:hypothetical protein